MIVEFNLKAKDNVSDPAKAAKKSLEHLGEKMSFLQDKMKGLEQEAFLAKVLGDTGKLKTLTSQWDLMNAAMSDMRAQKNALPDMTEQTSKLSAVLSVAAKGASVLATAFVAVGSALGAATFAGARFAIEANQDKIAGDQLFGILSGGRNTAEEVADAIEALANRLHVAKGQLEDFAKPLMAMGIRDLPDLEQAVHANAAAFAMMGEKGSSSFQSLQKRIQMMASADQPLKLAQKNLARLADMGINVDDVAKKMGVSAKTLGDQLTAGTANAKKFGQALNEALIEKGVSAIDRMSLQLSSIRKRFDDSISDIFEDVEVTPFLREVRSLFEIFNQSKPSGQAMKTGIVGVFQMLFDSTTKLVPMIKHFFLDMVIWSLKAYIALKPIVKTMREWWAQHDGMDKLSRGLKSLLPAIIGIGAAAAWVVGGFSALAASLLAINVGVQMVFAGLGKLVGSTIGILREWATSAWTLGSDFVAGLIGGIKAGITGVVEAVGGLATAAKDTFKNALGIASPSKVMMQLGAFAGQGVAEGMSARVPDVHEASGGLAGAAAGGFANAAQAPAASGGGVTVYVEPGAIVINGGGGQGHTDLTEDAVSLLFERIALMQGL